MPQQPTPRDLSWMEDHPQAFSNAASEALQNYVYMLTLPETGRPFYIGKGQGNRIFAHVLEAATVFREVSKPPTIEDLFTDEPLRAEGDDDEQSLKIQTLISILAKRQMPGMYILREGMETPEEALRVEGACIDLVQYLFDRGLVAGLRNVQSGYGAATFRSVQDVEAAHGESFDLNDLPDRDPRAEVLFLNLNRRWGEVIAEKNSKTLYEVSNGWWKLNRSRAQRCQYVVVHALGVVRGVFKLTKWSERNAEKLVRFYADTTPAGGLPGPKLRNKNIAGVFTPGRAVGRYIGR